MTVSNIEHCGMCSNTVREINAWKFLNQVGFSIAKDPVTNTITVTGPVTGRMAHDAISPEFGVTNQFMGHFGSEGLKVELIENRPGKPDDFKVTLTGTAYNRAVEAEHSYMEHEASLSL